MEDEEVASEITDLLLAALKFSNRPIAGMAFCRHAIECIAHNKHYKQFGMFPNPNNKGEYPGLASVIKKINAHVDRQISEIMFSINAQTRGGLHWNNPSKKLKLKKKHVNLVVQQILIVCEDVLNIEIELSGKKLKTDQLSEVVGKTLSELLKERELAWGVNEELNLVDSKKKLECVLEIAIDSIGKGLIFDDWLMLGVCDSAITIGRYGIAEKLLNETRNAFVDKEDEIGEACTINIQARIAGIRGDDPEMERLLKLALDIFDKTKEYTRAGSILNNLGNIALQRGGIDDAEHYYFQALRLVGADKLAYVGVVQSLTPLVGLAQVKIAKKEYPDALNILSNILSHEDLKENDRTRNFLAGVKSLIGFVCIQLGDLDNMMVQSGRIPGNRLAGDVWLSSMSPEDAVLMLISNLKKQTKSSNDKDLNLEKLKGNHKSLYNKAETMLRESLSFSRKIGDLVSVVRLLGLLAHLLLKIGPTRWTESESITREVVKISNENEFSLDRFHVVNGFTDPNASWDFPPEQYKSIV
jgi:tetratricopeptide (TPR) repeat protein